MALKYKFYLKNSENALTFPTQKLVYEFIYNTIHNYNRYRVSVYDSRGNILKEKVKVQDEFNIQENKKETSKESEFKNKYKYFDFV